jgi:hypothetical protein
VRDGPPEKRVGVRHLAHILGPDRKQVNERNSDVSSLVRNVPLFTSLEVSFFCFVVVIGASASASP